jgi:acetylornithine deacetylase/succinyl-diaminopimelate desuccinylase-like protein
MFSVLAFLAALMLQSPAGAHDDLAREIYKELVEINTTNTPAGDNTKAAEAMAARLRSAGLPDSDVRVLAPHPKKGNLVARYRGTGQRRPLLLLAHLDVVDALREDWSVDPFTFLERDGYFYGRGTADDKAMAAIWVATFIRFKREGYVPDRDLILALTADEEVVSEYNGVDWLLTNHRDLIDAEAALNEGGGGQIKDGKNLINAVQAAEKVYQSFRLEVKNPGGHSSRPERVNAIYELAEGLTRIAQHQFPINITEITRAYFQKMAGLLTGRLASDYRAAGRPQPDRVAVTRLSRLPYENALMRTTCVATQLEAGHAENALPQTARATVNCRILPGESPSEVHATLIRVVANNRISVVPLSGARPSEPSPLVREIMGPIERVTSEMWPGVAVVPLMSTGATDGLFLRNAGIPTYGISGLFGEVEDNRAHGKDERMGVRQFYEGREFLYRLVKALSS